MSVEIELKIWVSTQNRDLFFEQLAQLLQELGASAVQSDRLLNAYFETASQWFRQHDIGLRTRLKKGRYEQTIKLSGQQQGALHARPEYNVPISDSWPNLHEFPTHIWPQGTEVSKLSQSLAQSFRTDFTRHLWQLELAPDTHIELVFDEGAVVAGDAMEAICEIELELLQGKAQSLFTVAHQLVTQLTGPNVSLQLGFQSKAERGYRLAQRQPLQWQNPSPQASAEQLLRAVLQNHRLLATATAELPQNAAEQMVDLWQQLLQQLNALAATKSAQAQQAWLPLLEQAPAWPLASEVQWVTWLLDLTQWMFQE